MTWQERNAHAVSRKQMEEAQAYGRPSPYKMVWLFTIGCVVGFLLETVFTYFNKGYLESRRGMVIGPFNQVYGFGILAMVWMLSPLTGRRKGVLFLGSALVGGAFEFIMSFVQEKMLGTRSWDYTHDPLSILNGRTSFIFMFYWGVLGVLLMRHLYPFLSRLIDRIPRREGEFMARAMAGFLAVNMLLSLAAVVRWGERRQGVQPSNAIEESLDTYFPDDKLEQIYPTMVITAGS